MANQTCRAVSAKTLLFVKEEENGIKMDGLVSSERFFYSFELTIDLQ
jgi:hypothetical protein